MDRSSAILERLLGLHPREIDLSLRRVTRLAAAIGDPQKRIAPVIHVAGTNGKGSTTAFLRSMLEAAGKRVNVYTSPHLVAFRERIRLGGSFVDDDELADTLLHVEAVNAGLPITQFEITTAAAFQIFANHPADYTLLEVGLGGRLDATNIIDPLASVITPVSLDHEKFLGERIEQIAMEKAGIIKEGRPVIVASQTGTAMAVIESTAADRKAPLFAANRDFVARREQGRMIYEDGDGLLDLPLPRLVGRHQTGNAGLAIATARFARLGLPATAIEAGLTEVNWPARMQNLASGALFDKAPAGSELWLDGGHNPGAGVVVAEAMADLEERSPRPLYLIAGMLTTKDPIGFFRPFATLARRVVTVPVPMSQAGRDPAELAEAARTAGLTAEPAQDVSTALGKIAGYSPSVPPRILICGSLYLAGTVLAENGTPPR